jgi:hypothetical protein
LDVDALAAKFFAHGLTPAAHEVPTEGSRDIDAGREGRVVIRWRFVSSWFLAAK